MKFDTDTDIENAIYKLVAKSEREAKKAVTQAANLFEATLVSNTPKDTGKAVSTTKQSNFKGGNTIPTKEVGYGSWYIHFPNVGTRVKGTVRQPAQRFQEKSILQTKDQILNIYKQALRRALK
ncbi:HK97-gp10 family putative phage morphogenesis protein [Mammaliicoccus sciuri]|uniref:HK97-gp10 family putative phage morphogenesis protein n=1 Tax=Mammaliicoccus sciuri TaxID=1296 RepID=UPI001E309935|nr:HK97-gp10 family putative phage morphogenesis protein [Mammaliicoccus sciuri]MCD8896592.1 HK97 gp10 family phage protein [Mammaliicoccus sciuri]